MKLNNDIITIEVAEQGAELISLKKEGREYMWTGDAAFWNRHAPILFPAVGKPFNNEIHVDGKPYMMKQHGFARDSRFVDLGDGRLRMEDTERMDVYPFRFGLEVCYRLADSSLEVSWRVENNDERDIFFQIGAHPGFLLPDLCPLESVHGFVRYYDRNGNRVSPVIVSKLDDGNRVPLDSQQAIPAEMPITAESFAHDALMFEDGQVVKAVLCDREGKEVLSVCCPQAEAYGIWAPHKEGCPFVCLEPWCGICDPKGFTGDISSRQYIHRLAPKENYLFVYTIEILQ